MAVVRENTRTGMRYAWRDPQANDGILRADFWLAPGKPGAPDHINPSFAEHVTVLAGEAQFRLGDRRWRVAAGEEPVILPAGTVHNFTNPGSSELHVYVELQPGGTYREFLDAVFDRGGRTTARGLPLNPLRLAVLQDRYPDSIYVPGVPAGLQHASTRLIARLGRRLGYE